MKSLGHRAPVTADLALLVARVVIGGVFIAHGWQKFHTWGLDGTRQSFDQMGVPLPDISATFAAGVELIGGVLLVLGAFMPVVGLLLAIDMVGALVFAHAGNGVFVDAGGWEMVAVYGAASLLLAVVGSGRFGLDGVLGRQRSAVKVEEPALTSTS